MRPRSKPSGFTLIEVVFVLAVIGIILSAAVPNYASYLARQLYDMQHGARSGEWSALMKASLAKLTEEDLVAIAAYAASLAP